MMMNMTSAALPTEETTLPGVVYTPSRLRVLCLRVATAVLLLGTALPGMAACVPNVPLVSFSRTVSAPFFNEPDRPLFQAITGNVDFSCSAPGVLDALPVFSGMRYVRHIDGEPAYEMGPESPLVVMRLEMAEYDASGTPIESVEHPALESNKNNPRYVQGARVVLYVNLQFYSRGGTMRPLPQQSAGSVQVGNSDVAEFRFDLGYDFVGTTCALTDARVGLDPVDLRLLASQPSAGEKAFDVAMDCGAAAGRPISLEITDAQNRGNMSDVLTATPASTTQGVGLQILRNGAPLQMGTVWAHSASTGMPERVPFSARYVRTAGDLGAGSISAEAVLTANYY